MNSDINGWAEDRKLIIRFLSYLLENSEDIEGVMEEMSIYWNDDLDFISAMAEKTLRKIKEDSDEEFQLMPMYRSDEDDVFVKKLLRKAILNSEEHIALIDNNTTNWEIERIALMDTLVMQLALTEIREFPEIPVKVTLNEYIEIAKFYCTSKSSTFVNGILDKIVKEMRSKGIFEKKGRGLIGEINS
jgi:N utilization substance protein B